MVVLGRGVVSFERGTPEGFVVFGLCVTSSRFRNVGIDFRVACFGCSATCRSYRSRARSPPSLSLSLSVSGDLQQLGARWTHSKEREEGRARERGSEREGEGEGEGERERDRQGESCSLELARHTAATSCHAPPGHVRVCSFSF